MGPIEEFRIHIGAHKTATTDLQNTLSAQRVELRKAGIDYISRGVSEPLRRTSWRMIIPDRTHKRKWDKKLASARVGAPIMAISDENILGGARDLLVSPFYPRTETRLKALASLTGSARLVLFLSVRSFESLLPSAYVETIKARPRIGNFEPIRKNSLRQIPLWSELVSRIRSTLPNAVLRVWKYEDHQKHNAKIMSAFCGISSLQRVELPPAKRI
jgi:hypothetical protein